MRHTVFDGYRGVGVVLVILYHLGVSSVKNAWLEIGYFFTVSGILITNMSVSALEKGKFDVIIFWSRRITRLLPPLIILLWIVCGETWMSKEGLWGTSRELSSDQLTRRREELLCALGYCENFILIHRHSDYFASFDSPSPLRHLWSLSVEEQYYVLWPLLFLLVSSVFFPFSREKHLWQIEDDLERKQEKEGRKEERLRRTLKGLLVTEMGVIIMSVSASKWTLLHANPSATYYSSFTRMQDFAVGAACLIATRLSPLWPYFSSSSSTSLSISRSFRLSLVFEMGTAIGLGAMVLPALLPLSPSSLFPYYANGLETILSFLIAIGSLSSAFHGEVPPQWAIISRFLRSRMCVFAGYLSYSLYLFHWPLIVWFGNPLKSSEAVTNAYANIEEGQREERGGGEERDGERGGVGVDVAIVLVALMTSYLCFVCVEVPIMRLRSSLSLRSIFSFALLFSLLSLPLILLATSSPSSLSSSSLPSLPSSSPSPPFSLPSDSPLSPPLPLSPFSPPLPLSSSLYVPSSHQIAAVGDSQVYKIAQILRDDVAILNACLKVASCPLLEWKIENFAQVGKSVLVPFTSLPHLASSQNEKLIASEYFDDSVSQLSSVSLSLSLHQPDLVYFSDSHIRYDSDIWNAFSVSFPIEEKIRIFSEGLSRFILLCLSSHVKHVVLFTHPPFHPNRKNYTSFLLEVYHRGIASAQTNVSANYLGVTDSPISKGAMTIWIFDWHRLLCPDFDSVTSCPIGRYGFGSLLPDGLHVSGPSGRWLVGVTALLFDDILTSSLHRNQALRTCVTSSFSPKLIGSLPVPIYLTTSHPIP